MNEMNLPPIENAEVEQFYSYEQVATMTAISVTLVERFVLLNLVEPENAQLRSRDIARIVQILRLRRDLGVNWIGAGIILDMVQEISQLKAKLHAYDSHFNELRTGVGNEP